MFYEAMEDVLPDLKVIIESPSGNMQTIYPLESFTGDDDDAAGESSAENPDTAAGSPEQQGPLQ